jgi:hypothetical protein
MNNILHLLNPSFLAGGGVSPIGIGSVPGFAAGAVNFGASTIPRVGGMSMASIMPFVAQIMGMRNQSMPLFQGDIVQRPGQAINRALAASNPGYAAIFSSPSIYG